MASTAQPVASSIKQGVAPLRAGQGTSFLLRRLHSLTGVIPIGAFLIEHFVSNSEAIRGVTAYNKQVEFLTSLPFVVFLELFGIWLPILYHGVYGIYIWWRGESNVSDYPWAGNWLYAAQRWTGIIAFIYIIQHTYYLRFTGVHLLTNPHAAFAKVQGEFQNPWMVAFYAVGIVAASWHFSYGLWLFAAKWGITPGETARRRFGYVCLAMAVMLVAIGAVTMVGFLRVPYHPWNDNSANSIVLR